MPNEVDLIAMSPICPPELREKYFAMIKHRNALDFCSNRLEFLGNKVRRLYEEGTPDQKDKAIKAARAHQLRMNASNLEAFCNASGEEQVAIIRDTIKAMETELGKDAYGK